MHKYTNQLIHETSPYLLQHAYNPVNWFSWNNEALNKAKKENKPILVSIGYSACHWCHVMEKESFENEATAAIMNENFINIKIDREERPDLDHIYMDAVQAMTGSGGWPLNVFLTPDGKPFYGGTYFPPQRAFNRLSWQEVLKNVSQAFHEKRNEIDAQAENLTDHLIQSNAFGKQKSLETEEIFKREHLNEAYQNIMKSADTEWGGFGKAPKFPQTFAIQFLLRYHQINKKDSNLSESSKISQLSEEKILRTPLYQALLTLDKMIDGGLYDQLGGGFARYSTDAEWLAPHFEKMLYDNALLVSVLSEAYQLTRKERYKEIIIETIGFVQRELLHSQKGFYAALDADSEGEEGKFYVWDLRDAKEILGNDASIFCEYYDITGHGNWEGKNILHLKESLEDFSSRKDISINDLKELLEKGKKKLFKQRSKRIRPQLDDKIILGWNALMNIACSKAFAATGNGQFRQLAVDNMDFLLQKFSIANSNKFHHTWKNNIAKYPAFIDDYAFLIQALIHLQEITADTKWLIKAKSITEFVIENFSESEIMSSESPGRQAGLFFYTEKNQQDVIIRKKEAYDGAVPSGNSVMAYNLYHLSILFDKKEWKQRSFNIISSLGKAIISYPTSFGNWVCLLQEMIAGTYEIVLTGNEFAKLHSDLLQQYIPQRVLMASATLNPNFPLLADKPITDPPSIWLCKDFSCQHPVTSIKELIPLINSPERQ
ncbi:MAG TPA: thioredoxin domain-containing protein [Chitinophagaceae bacterium]|nr:thioredoxin domain-containing protein [Chitinophagaceae bacterium]